MIEYVLFIFILTAIVYITYNIISFLNKIKGNYCVKDHIPLLEDEKVKIILRRSKPSLLLIFYVVIIIEPLFPVFKLLGILVCSFLFFDCIQSLFIELVITNKRVLYKSIFTLIKYKEITFDQITETYCHTNNPFACLVIKEKGFPIILSFLKKEEAMLAKILIDKSAFTLEYIQKLKLKYERFITTALMICAILLVLSPLIIFILVSLQS